MHPHVWFSSHHKFLKCTFYPASVALCCVRASSAGGLFLSVFSVPSSSSSSVRREEGVCRGLWAAAGLRGWGERRKRRNEAGRPAVAGWPLPAGRLPPRTPPQRPAAVAREEPPAGGAGRHQAGAVCGRRAGQLRWESWHYIWNMYWIKTAYIN